MSATRDKSPIFIVVYGPPGTGKTTLLAQLRARNADPWCAFRFVTLDEPTRGPVIASLLQRMYTETAADIAAGRSVAHEVQTRIMHARAASYTECMNSTLEPEMLLADACGKQLVLVCDGHLTTDDKLYVRSKYDAGQISTQQLITYSGECAQLLATLPVFVAAPAFYCQLVIANDTDGTKHYRRVVVQRQDETERGVAAQVFARLASYAETTRMLLQKNNGAQVLTLNTDALTPTEVCNQFIAMIAERCASDPLYPLPPVPAPDAPVAKAVLVK